MARWPMAAVCTLLLLGACAYRALPTETKPLWHGRVDDVDVKVTAELHGAYEPGTVTVNLGWESGGYNFTLFERFQATRGGKPMHVLDLEDPPENLGTPNTRIEGRARLHALVATACPLPHGVALHLGGLPPSTASPASQWAVTWVLGNTVLRGILDPGPKTCAEVTAAAGDRDSWLAAHPGGSTTCRLLDDAGRHDLLVGCALATPYDDLFSDLEPPRAGDWVKPSREYTDADGDEIVHRIATDPARVAAFEQGVLAGKGDSEMVLDVLDAAHDRDAFVKRAAAQCADPKQPCPDALLDLVQRALRPQGTPTPAACKPAAALVAAVRARGGADADAHAFRVARGFYECDEPALRALYVDGLNVVTSKDTPLPSADYTAYSLIDSDCQPYLNGDVGPTCETLARFAGHWLAAHCGPDAVKAAKKIALPPRVVVDPREDQRLDGALMVLAGCDPKGFEAAISKMPETTLAAADVRSKEHLRQAFLHKPAPAP